MLLTNELPSRSNNDSVSVPKSSRVIDLTLDTWTPKPRCLPLHSIHNNIPKLILAHVGPLELQSAHLSFPGSLLNSLKIFLLILILKLDVLLVLSFSL
jgi:hypothetical protein